MAFGNYDAGQSRPVSNPLFNGGLRKVDAGKTEFDFGFNKAGNVDGVKSGWSVERTSTVTPEERVANEVAVVANTMNSIAEQGDSDRELDAILNQYITPETRKNIASTSFNAAMMLGAFDDAYKLLA